MQEHGKGQIVDNYVANNRWAGIDVGRGSEPLVCRNLICNGGSNGVTIGRKARAWLEANTIKGTGYMFLYRNARTLALIDHRSIDRKRSNNMNIISPNATGN